MHEPLSNILNHLSPARPKACVFEPLSPRQAEDAEEGKKLLAQDKEALIKVAKTGDTTKVGRILALRLSIPATLDRTVRTS